jgi:dsRNA-specific ribonuclease
VLSWPLTTHCFVTITFSSMDEPLTASLVISPGELPSISDERLVADALICLSSSQSDDKNRLLKNQQLAEIGHATINYCLTLAVCNTLDDDWKSDECAKVKLLLLDHQFTSLLAKACGLRDAAGLTDGKFDHDAKILALSFEAYIGAIHKDGNSSAAHAWLDKIFTPYILPTLQLLRTKDSSPRASGTTTNAVNNIPTPPADTHVRLRQDQAPRRVVAGPEGSLQHLNQALGRAKLSNKLEWYERNAAPTLSDAPQWEFTAHFQRNDGTVITVGQARHHTKKEAKNAAAHNAYLKLRQMRQLNE